MEMEKAQRGHKRALPDHESFAELVLLEVDPERAVVLPFPAGAGRQSSWAWARPYLSKWAFSCASPSWFLSASSSTSSIRLQHAAASSRIPWGPPPRPFLVHLHADLEQVLEGVLLGRLWRAVFFEPDGDETKLQSLLTTQAVGNACSHTHLRTPVADIVQGDALPARYSLARKAHTDTSTWV